MTIPKISSFGWKTYSVSMLNPGGTGKPTNRDEGEDIASCIDSNEYKRDAPDSAVDVDVIVVAQDAC